MPATPIGTTTTGTPSAAMPRALPASVSSAGTQNSSSIVLMRMSSKRTMLKNQQFATRYWNRAKEVLTADGLLGQHSVVEVWDSLYNTISSALYCEAARWGDYRRDVHPYAWAGELYTVDNHYTKEHKRLRNQYFPVRTQRVFNQIKAYLPATVGIRETMKDQCSESQWYDLNGRPVVSPSHGLYIRNGKKYHGKEK